jgi:hypothetical protein
LGRRLAFALTGGEVHDGPILPRSLNPPVPPPAICADKAYDSTSNPQAIIDDGAMPIIPYRSHALKMEAHSSS